MLVADCVPVPSRPLGRHGRAWRCSTVGWRGLAAGIVERAPGTFDKPPAAAIGPGIGACCYEVGQRGRRKFAGRRAWRRRMLDLRAVVRRNLEACRSIGWWTSTCARAAGRTSSTPHRRDNGVTGRQVASCGENEVEGLSMPDARERFTDLRPERTRVILDRVRERIAAAGREPDEVEVAPRSSTCRSRSCRPRRRRASSSSGNRGAGPAAAQDSHGQGLFSWDFIGALQSRKARDVAPRVRLIHPVASDSALRKLRQHPAEEVLVEVNWRRRARRESSRRSSTRLYRALPGPRDRADDDAPLHRAARRTAARTAWASPSWLRSGAWTGLSMGTT